MSSSLKQLKEQFVSDLTGGTIEEIYAVTSIALSSYLSFRLLKKSLGDLALIYDYILNVLTILASITVYSNSPSYLHYFIVIPSLVIYLVNYHVEKPSSPHRQNDTKEDKSDELLPRKQFITAYRSQMLIITNLAILAVDFPIFPRRFAKVETWGTSMMDLGVGSFVFSMGLANSRQLIKNHTDNYKFSWKSYLKTIKQNFIKSVPILVLGAIRFVSVKQLDYQEHETEYGIHWNFFFTLGFLPIVLGILDPVLNLVPRFIIGIGISIGYEVALNKTGLLKFILSSENRLESLIAMNKEGIFSFIGYLCIFIIGQSFGSFVLTGYKTKNNLITISKIRISKKQHKKELLLFFSVATTQGLYLACIFYHLAFSLFISNLSFLQPISRRLANFPYVMWVVSYNATFLLCYDLIEKFIPGNLTSTVLDSINNNGLFIFLVSNLLTGFINMSINTLETSNKMAVIILIGYSLTWTLLALYLDKRKIYIKL